MTASSITKSKKLSPWTINVIVSVTITTFLFFIDEGYYNFAWTKNIGNWIAFLVYATFMVLGQFITDKYILKWFKVDSKNVLTSIIGIPLGIAILLTTGYFLSYVF